MPYLFHWPFISSIQPSRIILLIDFSLAIFAAYGLEEFKNKVENKKSILISVALSFVVLIILASSLLDKSIFPFAANLNPAQIAFHNSILAVFISFLLMLIVILKFFKVGKTFLLACLFSLTILELFRFSYKFIPFTKISLIFPQTTTLSYLQSQPKPFRIMTTDRRILHPNSSSFYRIESVDGYDPLYLKSYGQFINSLQSSKFENNFGGFNRIVTPQKVDSPLINLLNVKYVLSFDEIKDSNFKKVFEEGITKVYENSKSLPRAFFVDSVIKENDSQAVSTLIDKNVDLSKIATSQEYESSALSGTGNIKIISYNDNVVKLKTDTDSPRPLVVSIPFYPGWHAKINGQETKIYKTDLIFQSIIVPTGNHIIEFSYQIRYWQTSLILSSIGLSLVVLISFIIWRRKFL